MKRMTLIAVTLCVLLLTTVGTGAVMAKQASPPSDRVMQFDVTYQGKAVGKLIINTNAQTYVFNGKGLAPDTTYYLVCKVFMRSVGSAKATHGGTVHIQGSCNNWSDALAERPTFELYTAPPVAASNLPYIDARWTQDRFWLTWRVCGQFSDLPQEVIGYHVFPNQKLQIWVYDSHKKTYVLRTTVTTISNGAFDYTRYASLLYQPETYPPKVMWNGGYINGQWWDPVTIPALPL
jgi:hypothetical protein